MIKSNTDIPITNIDDDQLKLKKYVDGLAEYIKECATPMTISIQGDWGSGKTSIMNMVRICLEPEYYIRSINNKNKELDKQLQELEKKKKQKEKNLNTLDCCPPYLPITQTDKISKEIDELNSVIKLINDEKDKNKKIVDEQNEIKKNELSVDKRKYKTVWFNTWQFSQFANDSNLVASMIYVLLDQLGYNGNTFSNVYMNFAKTVSRIVGSFTDDKVGGRLGEAAENLSLKILELFTGENKSETIANLKSTLQICINNKLNTDGYEKLIVFVDDLDRLQPKVAVELLEVLKLFLDCDDCVFVLAVDYDVVVTGVKGKYGKDFTVDKGKQFFDKLIQLPFKMPISSYDISGLLDIQLEKSMEFSKEDKKDDTKAILKELLAISSGYNPRGVKRVFNSFQLLKLVEKDKFCQENKLIEAIDWEKVLFAVVCAQSYYEKFYNYLCKNKDFLTKETFKSVLNETVSAKSNFSEFKEHNDEYPVLKDIYDHDIATEKELAKLQAFSVAFVKALHRDFTTNMDNNELFDSLLDSEIELLRKVLTCADITSVREDDMEGLDIEQERGMFSFYFVKLLKRKLQTKFKSDVEMTPTRDFNIPKYDMSASDSKLRCNLPEGKCEGNVNFLDFVVERRDDNSVFLTVRVCCTDEDTAKSVKIKLKMDSEKISLDNNSQGYWCNCKKYSSYPLSLSDIGNNPRVDIENSSEVKKLVESVMNDVDAILEKIDLKKYFN